MLRLMNAKPANRYLARWCFVGNPLASHNARRDSLLDQKLSTSTTNADAHLVCLMLAVNADKHGNNVLASTDVR
eukprot:2285079-Amphidinium_carterae.1